MPTEAGTRLLEQLAPALAEVDAALDVVNRFRDKPAGLVVDYIGIAQQALRLDPAVSDVVPYYMLMLDKVRSRATQIGGGDGITACEQGHLMTLGHQFLGEV